MGTIIRNVRDIETGERRALEQVLGQPLMDNQQIFIHVVTIGNDSAEERSATTSGLPDWCNIYEGLTDEHLADIERVILERCDLTRPSE